MKVQLPDGKIAEFPDNMSQEDIAAVLREQYTNPAREISTKTGKVVPTVKEHVEQASSGYKTAAAKALPIAGDIAGTSAGGAAGQALKAPKLLGVLLKAIGAGIGGAGGSAGGQVLERGEVSGKEALAQGAVGAATELGGAAIKPAVRPVLDFASDLTIGGRQIKNIWRDKIIDRTTKAAQTFSDSYRPSMTKGEAGLKVGDVLKKKTDFEEVYKGYNEALQAHEGPIAMDATDEFLQGVRDNIKETLAASGGKKLNRPVINSKVAMAFDLDPKGRKVLKQLIEEGTLSPDDTKYLLAKVNKNYSKMTPRERNLAKGLKESLVKDIDFVLANSGATAAELKQTADKIYGEAHEWFKANPTAKRITQKMRMHPGSYFEAFPEKSLDAVFSTDPKEIARIRYQVTKTAGGEQAWTAGVYNHIREIYENSMMVDQATGGITKVLPAKLADTLEARLPSIKMMDSGVAKKIEKEIAYYREFASEFAKRGKTGATQVAGPALGYALGGTAAIPVAESFGVISALAVMSPKANKILSSMAKGVTKIGGHISIPEMPAH